MTRVSFDTLCTFTRGVLDAAGLDAFSAEAVTTGLCEASLRGVDSHGVRLLPHYVRSAEMGRKNPRPAFTFDRPFPAFGTLDADNGFGHAAGMKAVDHAVEMAAEAGLGAVAVFNSSHSAAMASFALRAARQGFIGVALTHADALLKSHDGTRAYFGTNPVCVAAPRQEDEPFCLDMATSGITWNRLLVLRALGEPLPDGTGADATGAATRDADAATALMPLGGTVAGYKGVGLASVVELLCGVLTGMAFGREIPAMYSAPMDRPRRLGQFYLAMRIDACLSADAFRERLQRMCDELRDEPGRDGANVLAAGDKEIAEARRRRRVGVPLDNPTTEALRRVGDTFGLVLETV